jgi:hypothetical protein
MGYSEDENITATMTSLSRKYDTINSVDNEGAAVAVDGRTDVVLGTSATAASSSAMDRDSGTNNSNNVNDSSSITNNNKDNTNNSKLREGPCATQYELLQRCQAGKRIVKPSNAMTLCVSETDLLIRCVHKHPAFFHDVSTRK